jgi:hypothetical protein
MRHDRQAAEQRDVDESACLLLLGSQRVGRLVLPGEVPFVAPVNYVLAERALHFRTDSGSPASKAHGVVGVFEVDAVDLAGHSGWSVIVRGTVEDVTDSVEGENVVADGIEPWAPGPKDRRMRLLIEQLSGRWVRGEQEAWAPDERGYL